MKKVLILSNHFITIYAYRKELVKKLLEQNIKVYITLPESEENDYFRDMGCEIITTPIDRRGTNPISDIKLLLQYINIINNVKPDLILTYTIKPNTYGGIAARICKADIIHTVTGLGSVYIQKMWQSNIAILLNKIAFKLASKIIFLNDDNRDFYKKMKIVSKNHNTLVVPGSGVNFEVFKYQELKVEREITFTFIGRILKDKGIEEYLIAAKEISIKYNNVKFEVVGFVDDKKYYELLRQYEEDGIITYLGKRNDIPYIMKKSSCIVLPSYGEGRGTVLQEGAAIGRPLITCDTYGCKENVEEGYNGYLCEVANINSLINAIEKYINLSEKDKKIMGKRSREKAEREFDRKKIVEVYYDEISKIIKG